MSRFAILCPGQGAQHAGMFDLLRQHPGGAALLQAHAATLADGSGVTLETILADDQLLFANRHAQALIVMAGLAAWECLRDSLPPPSLVAGYSVGELTAYSVAGLWSAPSAVAVALARARYMDDCLLQVPQQGLMAVGGIAVASVAELLAAHQLHVAIETGFDTLIAGGRSADLLAAQAELLARGARCSRLPVGIASHTPLMAAAVAPLAQLLEQLDWQAATATLIAGVSGLEVHGQQAASTALLQQLSATIHWSACMDACAERGIEVVLELGPGSALSRMLRERYPQIECRSLADFRSLGGALQWLQRRLD
jgi:[acyl-carrier-protein] S-malonyltransferase